MNHLKKFNSKKNQMLVFEDFELYFKPEGIKVLRNLQWGSDNQPERESGIDKYIEQMTCIQDIVSEEAYSFTTIDNLRDILSITNDIKNFFLALTLPSKMEMENLQLEAINNLKQ